jgi:uncharacterized protein YqjF (DUF2071 family)
MTDEPIPIDCPSPVTSPVMVQSWNEIVFVHWRYEPSEVQQLLPTGVEVDTFDGSAWVGLIPFHMDGLGLPPSRLHPLPHVGSFPEVNIRTYVRSRGRRGVYFLSLDIDRYLPAVVARLGYRIPYCVGDVRHLRVGDRVMSSVDRRWPRSGRGATAAMSVRVGAAIDSDPLAAFLTARWGLISSNPDSRFGYAPVDHPAWQLQEAEIEHFDERLTRAAGLSAPVGTPHVVFSAGTDVRIGWPRRVDQ